MPRGISWQDFIEGTRHRHLSALKGESFTWWTCSLTENTCWPRKKEEGNKLVPFFPEHEATFQFLFDSPISTCFLPDDSWWDKANDFSVFCQNYFSILDGRRRGEVEKARRERLKIQFFRQKYENHLIRYSRWVNRLRCLPIICRFLLSLRTSVDSIFFPTFQWHSNGNLRLNNGHATGRWRPLRIVLCKTIQVDRREHWVLLRIVQDGKKAKIILCNLDFVPDVIPLPCPSYFSSTLLAGDKQAHNMILCVETILMWSERAIGCWCMCWSKKKKPLESPVVSV